MATSCDLDALLAELVADISASPPECSRDCILHLIDLLETEQLQRCYSIASLENFSALFECIKHLRLKSERDDLCRTFVEEHISALLNILYLILHSTMVTADAICTKAMLNLLNNFCLKASFNTSVDVTTVWALAVLGKILKAVTLANDEGMDICIPGDMQFAISRWKSSIVRAEKTGVINFNLSYLLSPGAVITDDIFPAFAKCEALLGLVVNNQTKYEAYKAGLIPMYFDTLLQLPESLQAPYIEYCLPFIRKCAGFGGKLQMYYAKPIWIGFTAGLASLCKDPRFKKIASGIKQTACAVFCHSILDTGGPQNDRLFPDNDRLNLSQIGAGSLPPDPKEQRAARQMKRLLGTFEISTCQNNLSLFELYTRMIIAPTEMVDLPLETKQQIVDFLELRLNSVKDVDQIRLYLLQMAIARQLCSPKFVEEYKLHELCCGVGRLIWLEESSVTHWVAILLAKLIGPAITEKELNDAELKVFKEKNKFLNAAWLVTLGKAVVQSQNMPVMKLIFIQLAACFALRSICVGNCDMEASDDLKACFEEQLEDVYSLLRLKTAEVEEICSRDITFSHSITILFGSVPEFAALMTKDHLWAGLSNISTFCLRSGWETTPVMTNLELLLQDTKVDQVDDSAIKSLVKVCAECKSAADSNSKLRRCSRCKSVYYCNATCQKLNWPKHKSECNNN